jgi:hypothetical protein
MALVALTPATGTTPYDAAPAGEAEEKACDATEHNSFPNDGRTYLVIRNKDAAATHTVKILDAATGNQIGSTLTIGKSKSVLIGPFPVFQQVGTEVRVDANSAEILATVFTIPHGASAKR